MDFDSICRLCLESNKQTFDIFTSFYLKRNILYLEMLVYCTKLRPYQGDGLPKLVCKECIKLLKRLYTFKIRCEENDNKLREYKGIPTTTTNCEDNVNYVEVELDMKECVKEEIDSIDNEAKVHELLNEDAVSENIKIEPNYNSEGDDSYWNADDNILLTDVNLTKIADDVEIKTDNFEEKTKKKRGRKRKDGSRSSKCPHQCDICGKILSTRSNLNAHKVCHTELRPYKCLECSATFRGHSALFQHKKTHTGETPYHCEYCPKRFGRRTGLVNHIRIHTGEKLYSCDICFKTFIQKPQLSVHMKRHKGDKSYLCQECGKGFPIKSDLIIHQRIHNGEKPYSCQLCPKSFSTSGNLAIHVRVHNREVKYTCKECSRGFVTHSAYSVHVKRHSGQRDFRCECGKMFYTASALKQHRVVHTGEKRYQCKICLRKFSQTSHLSRHFKRDHAKPGGPCPPSEQYKIILKSNYGGEKDNAGIQKINSVNAVKCEGT